jgi:hypothetical protein
MYSTIVSDPLGNLFWKSNVEAITVYVDGVPKPITLGASATGGPFLTATLDTGVPFILTTTPIANGIYGALGISPASDGQCKFLLSPLIRLISNLPCTRTDYVPCMTPLNMAITLDNRPEIALHPLDLTSEPPQDATSDNCIGLIQVDDQQLANPTSYTGDIILGVPFLRNVYIVMAYDPPDANGSFTSNIAGGNSIAVR